MSNARYNQFPSKPAFRAYKNVNGFTPTTASVIVWDTAVYNHGSHYSTSTGYFTAPFAGIYHFSLYSITQGNLNNGQWNLYINGARIKGGDVHFSHNTGSAWDNVAWNGDVELSEGDYVEVRSQAPTTFHGSFWSHFCGHLVT